MTAPTNSAIFQALSTTLNASGLGYPVAWPGVDFTPPATGVWLEVLFFPNQPLDPTLSSAGIIPRGFLQIEACTRPGGGIQSAQEAAEAVLAVFPKLTSISGLVRVYQTPYAAAPLVDGDRISVPVTISYSA